MRLGGGLLVACVVALAACGGGGASSDGAGGDASGGVKNAVAAPTGAVASKMQPQLNGWAFPNFPSATFPDINFDTADLVSMFGAGADVCVDAVADPCTLTAEAAAWARMVNQARATGHCEGLVALASARFNKSELPETVKLPSQEDEIRALMRAFATQFVPEVQAAIEKWTKASLADKVDELKRSFSSDKLEYTLGVYVEGGGHAVLPYAVEYPSADVARIMVYDSNWPGRNRYVDVDLRSGKWTFSFAGDDPTADPNAWTGGAGDMDLTPFEAREGSCPFCGDGTRLQSTTLLVRTENLDWSVETGSGVVSPTSAASGDGAAARPVKGGVSIVRMAAPAGGRSSYDYVITIPNSLLDGGAADPSTTAGSAASKKRAKLNFGGASSVFAVMQSGVAQFTTPGGAKSAPVEVGASSIKSNDPNVDLTLAAGNLVANASGSSVELGSTGGTLEVAVTTATGEVIQQQVTPEAPAVQVKADESGAVTVLQASATGEVKKTEVAADGTKTESVVDASALNLNKVEVELPPALASKAIEALPSLEQRNLNNPTYKVDEAYVPPTTVPVAKEGAAGPTTTAPRNETPSTLQTRNAALPTTTAPRSVTAAGATPTTIAAVVKPTLTNFRVTSKAFGDDAFTLDPPDSNSPGGFRYTSSRSDVATVSATTGRVTLVGAGSTVITATQAAVRGFEAGTITATLTVSKARPTITETKDIVKAFGDDAFIIKDPTSTSLGAFSFSSSNEEVVKQSRLTGRWVIGGAGRATITLTQTSTDNHFAATDSFTVSVRKGAPDVKAPIDVAKTFLDADFDLPKPTSQSKGTFTFASSDSEVLSVTSSGRASIKSNGTSTITVTQATTDDWLASSTTYKVSIGAVTPTLSEFDDTTKTFGDGSFIVPRPKSPSSGVFTFASSDEKVITIGSTDGKVTIVGAGTATVTVTQAASKGYSETSIARKFTIGKAAPVISDLIVADKEFGGSDFTLKPTSTSSGKITFATDKSDIFDVNETTGAIRIVGVGTATLTAKQASTVNYEAASVSATVTVKKGTPVLSWNPGTKTFGDADFDLSNPASPSAGRFTFSVAGSDATRAILLSSGKLRLLRAGTVSLTAKQESTTLWNEAIVTGTLTIEKAAPTITNFVIPAKTYGDSAFDLVSPTSNSPGRFTYEIVPGTSLDLDGLTSVASIASVSNLVSGVGRVSVGLSGSVRIIARQLSSDNFAAGSITATFTVNKAAQVVSGQQIFGITPTELTSGTSTPLSLIGDTNLVGSASYAIVSGGTAQCALSRNDNTAEWSISAAHVGTCVIRATKDGDRNFLPVSTPDTTMTFGTPTFNAPTNLQASVNGNQVTLTWDPGVATNFAPYMWSITWYDMDSGQPTGGWGIWNLADNRSSTVTIDSTTSGYGVTRFTVHAGNGPCVGVGTGQCSYGPTAFTDVNFPAPNVVPVVQAGLIGHLDAANPASYPASGNVWNDLSQANNDAILVGVTRNNAGYMEFGSGKYANWGQPLSTGSSYSIDAWVWRNSYGGNQNIASTNQSPFWFASGPLCAGIAGSYTRVCQTNSTINAWMHAAVTFDDPNNSMTLYLNGVQVSSSTTTQTFVEQLMTIGDHNNGTAGVGSVLNGRISSIRLYNRALTAAEIAQNYSATAPHCTSSSCQNLAFWMDPADTSTWTQSNGAIVSVADKSGSNRGLSQTNASMRPGLSSSTRNGRNYFEFASTTRLDSAPTTLSQPMTAFAVVRNGVTDAANRQVLGNAESPPSPVIYKASGVWRQYAGTELVSQTAVDQSWHYISAVYNGPTSTLYLDGVKIAEGQASSGGWSNSKITIGDASSPGYGWIGDIAEVMIFSGALSAADRLHTENYLASKWGFSPQSPGALSQ